MDAPVESNVGELHNNADGPGHHQAEPVAPPPSDKPARRKPGPRGPRRRNIKTGGKNLRVRQYVKGLPHDEATGTICAMTPEKQYEIGVRYPRVPNSDELDGICSRGFAFPVVDAQTLVRDQLRKEYDSYLYQYGYDEPTIVRRHPCTGEIMGRYYNRSDNPLGYKCELDLEGHWTSDKTRWRTPSLDSEKEMEKRRPCVSLRKPRWRNFIEDCGDWYVRVPESRNVTCHRTASRRDVEILSNERIRKLGPRPMKTLNMLKMLISGEDPDTPSLSMNMLQLPEGCPAPQPWGVNNNATFNLGISNIDLATWFKEFTHIPFFFGRARFSALCVKIVQKWRDGTSNNVIAAIYRSGKVVMVGLKQIEQALLGASMLVKQLRKCGVNCRVSNFTGNNQVTVFNFGFEVDIEKFYLANIVKTRPTNSFQTAIKYFPKSDPTKFGKARWRSPVLSLNYRGKGVILGTRSYEETVQVYLELYHLVQPFIISCTSAEIHNRTLMRIEERAPPPRDSISNIIRDLQIEHGLMRDVASSGVTGAHGPNSGNIVGRRRGGTGNTLAIKSSRVSGNRGTSKTAGQSGLARVIGMALQSRRRGEHSGDIQCSDNMHDAVSSGVNDGMVEEYESEEDNNGTNNGSCEDGGDAEVSSEDELDEMDEMLMAWEAIAAEEELQYNEQGDDETDEPDSGGESAMEVATEGDMTSNVSISPRASSTL
ncbi:hypothetical protein KDA14_03070 [Candidatus Saccharibacteria bacterium]|nr:hypothetical protein [Candidatus Saccharibacteria bacterium]